MIKRKNIIIHNTTIYASDNLRNHISRAVRKYVWFSFQENWIDIVDQINERVYNE